MRITVSYNEYTINDAQLFQNRWESIKKLQET